MLLVDTSTDTDIVRDSYSESYSGLAQKQTKTAKEQKRRTNDPWSSAVSQIKFWIKIQN